MTTVFIVQHSRCAGSVEDVKLIGVYASDQAARSAIERLKRLPGFNDGGAFSVDGYELDRDYWAEGFKTKVTIYVKLLDEGVDVWRPVLAEKLRPGLYRIVDSVPETEIWEFGPGAIVRCEETDLSGGPQLVAKEEVHVAA